MQGSLFVEVLQNKLKLKTVVWTAIEVVLEPGKMLAKW